MALTNEELTLMVAIFGAIALFLTMRAFWLWYLGTSRIIELLESIDESLQQLPAVQEHRKEVLRREIADYYGGVQTAN